MNPGFDSVAWQLLYRVKVWSICVTLIYIVYDLLFNEGPTYTPIAICALGVYIFFIWLMIRFPENRIVVNILVVSNLISLALSFTFLDDRYYIKAPTIIDFSLALLVVITVYRKWERIIWSFAHLCLLGYFINLSVYYAQHPVETNEHVRCCSDLWFYYVEVFSRLIFIFILGMTFIQEYDRQRMQIVNKNAEVLHLNKNLETLIAQRTEKLNKLNVKLKDYAFINSHKVRAPLARILGIMNLIKMHKTNPENLEINEYLELLSKAAGELDAVIREMNAYLAEDEI